MCLHSLLLGCFLTVCKLIHSLNLHVTLDQSISTCSGVVGSYPDDRDFSWRETRTAKHRLSTSKEIRNQTK